MEQLPIYEYLELPAGNYIRVLVLEPGSGDEIVRCTLKAIPLDQADGQYDGISYVWGSSTYKKDILCDGKRLGITLNLYDVLHKFRERENQIIIWADAICIHQGHPTEKGHQVRRMGEIYKRARRVLCWLGNDDHGIAKGCFELVGAMSQQIREQTQPGWTITDLIYNLQLPDFMDLDPEQLDTLKHLFELPWFKRLWIVQESGLAREAAIHWGEQHIDLYSIIQVAFWLGYSIHAPRIGNDIRIGQVIVDVFVDIQATYDNEDNWRKKVPVTAILDKYYPLEKQLWVDVLMCVRGLEVSDQRDTVYASLGSPLALDQHGNLMVEPNYTEPVGSLFMRTAQALLKNHREAPHLLLRVSHQREEDLNDRDYPTWAPRWYTFGDQAIRPYMLTLTIEHRQHPYHASYGTPAFDPQIQPGHILQVSGLIFDLLAWTSFVLIAADLRSVVDLWQPRFREGKVSAIETVWQELLEHVSRPSNELVNELSMTTARGRPRSKDHVNDFLAYCQYLRSLIGSENPSPFPPPDPDRGVASDGEWTVARCRDRRLAYTSSRLALVPVMAEVGDICSVIQGLDVPVILRRTSRDTYKLVGEAYVHATMDGELVDPNLTAKPEWQSLRIE